MGRIRVLPHAQMCPEGAEIEGPEGMSLCDALLRAGIPIEHACEKACACTTCHILVRQGYEALEPASEKEEDLLDKAWGLEPDSRLSCQAKVPEGQDLVIEIPKYTINMVAEGH